MHEKCCALRIILSPIKMLQKTERIFILLFLWGIACLLDQHCLGQAMVMEKTLTRVTNTSYGSDRLGNFWLHTSLTQCVWSCISQYSSRCQTVMYNPVNHHCTPGSFYRTSTMGAALAPDITEGSLYAPLTCDPSDGFEVITSTKVSACLYISNDTMDFYNAREFCSNVGAHLISARSLDKFDLLPSGERFIIGLTDLAVEGVFAWEDNGEVIDPDFSGSIFRSGEPDNANNNEHCVTLAPNSTLPSGKDIPCGTNRHRFACERPMLK